MNYQQTVAYLYNQLPLFSRLGAAAIKKDLTNTIRICEALRNPQQQFKSIHIAGTNGKGSVSHMLAAILQTAGYKTGLYTSPHLKDFRERIKVNGQCCEKDFVVSFTEKVKPLIESIEPSFFEITVAMAFEYFAQQKVDIAIIETGLGGRLDSTNVIQPILSIITNIGYDHMNILGNTLPEIAFEKAGIIKQNTPVVIGEVIPETKAVFDNTAAQKDALIIYAEDRRFVTDFTYQHHQLQVTVADKKTDEHHTYLLDLPGIYQRKNLVTVLEAVHQLQLQAFSISQQQIATALQHVKKLTGLHGRWEVVHQQPTVIVDVAHNEDGMKQIAEQLELATYRQLYIIAGMVKDKAVNKALSYLPKTAHYYFTKAQTPRALPEEELQAVAASLDLHGATYPDVNTALKEVLTHAHKDDLILVCGSVFLVAEVEL
jgi:dihydrofolate synthase/folylpolyglutamate synthase